MQELPRQTLVTVTAQLTHKRHKKREQIRKSSSADGKVKIDDSNVAEHCVRESRTSTWFRQQLSPFSISSEKMALWRAFREWERNFIRLCVLRAAHYTEYGCGMYGAVLADAIIIFIANRKR